MTPSLDQNTWVTSLLWAKQMKSLESNETITSSQLKIIVIYMWEITCFLHNNFQLSEIVSGVWEMRNFKKFDCLVFCSIIATRPSDKSTVTATRPVWLCHSSGTIGRWFWWPLTGQKMLQTIHPLGPWHKLVQTIHPLGPQDRRCCRQYIL